MSRSVVQELHALKERLSVLEGEAEIRRVQARYMFLCDTPLPEPGGLSDAERVDRIMELYAEDAVWEGVGEYYDNQFGRCTGKAEIRAHFESFWAADKEPKLLLNCHYLTSEQIHVQGDTADGQWVHMQPWIFSNGKALLRSSRLNNAFRKTADGRWLITRTRTENVFVAPLSEGWASDFPSKSYVMD